MDDLFSLWGPVFVMIDTVFRQRQVMSDEKLLPMTGTLDKQRGTSGYTGR